MRPEITDLNRLVAALLAEPAPSPGRAAQLLAAHGGASTFALLIGMLSAQRPGARKLAADALAVLGNPQAIPDLAIVLTDPDERVRAAARQALDKLDPPRKAAWPAALPGKPQLPAGGGHASSAGAVTERLVWAQGELGPPPRRRSRAWRRALVGALLVAGLGLGGLLALRLDLPVRVSQLVPAAMGPGVGRPARDASWEVLLERAHHETHLPSMSGSFTPHDDYVFLVADLKIQSLALAGAPPHFAPNAVSLALPDNSAVYTPELIGLPMGAQLNYTSVLGLTSYVVGGESVYKDAMFSVPKDGLSVSFVFVVKQKDLAHPFQLRFASVPAIPFAAGAPGQATATPVP